MSVQNSIDLLQMSLSTLCLNKTKYDPSRHMRNLNLLFGRGIVWLLFLFENEMNEIGVCENDKNEIAILSERLLVSHLSSLFVSLL